MRLFNRFSAGRLGKLFAVVAILLASVAWVPVASAHGEEGVVYLLTNGASDNQVMVYSRTAAGRLVPEDSYSTGGLGTGMGLGSQGSLIADKEGEWLFAVNAATNDISVFASLGTRLFLTDKITSNGVHPISLTMYQNVIYVLNAGDMENAANITGFTYGHNGKLMPIAGSTRPLSTANPGPAQVQFSPDGGLLVVTEKMTNMISTYTVGADNLATGPNVQPSAGMTPFGFAFDNNSHLIVSEAFGGPPNPSAVSSYQVGEGGNLTVVTPSAQIHQLAACWVVVTKDGRYAYSANTGSGTVSGFSIGEDGSLTKLDANGVSGWAEPGTAEMALSYDNDYLYAVNGASNSISAFHIGEDGRLTSVRGIMGLPDGVAGLVAR